MSIVTVLLLAVAVSVDGFWSGLAFGLRRVRITVSALIVVSLITVVCTMVTMSMGRTMKTVVPVSAVRWVSAALLVGLGCVAFKEGLETSKSPAARTEEMAGLAPNTEVPDSSRMNELRQHPVAYLIDVVKDPLLADIDASGTISSLESTILGFAVALDASIVSFAIGLAGYSPFVIPWIIGLDHWVLVGLGNYVGTRRSMGWVINRAAFLPGVILIVLGALRLL